MRRNTSRAFSLLEVVIVVAIIAILAAIGIPRMSRGSRGAGYSALAANVSVLRNAVDLFAAEHQGTNPTISGFSNELTQYTDIDGNTSAKKTGHYIYGPYLRSIPVCPVGSHKDQSGVADANGTDIGWIYDPNTGDINANAADSEKDDAGKPLNAY